MKAILKFDLLDPDDAILHKTMHKALDMKMCLFDIAEKFRSTIKYNPDSISEEELTGWEAAREMFLNELEAYNILLDY